MVLGALSTFFPFSPLGRGIIHLAAAEGRPTDMSFQPIPMQQMPLTHDNIFLYSGPGIGKTLFACGSQTRRTFYFNVENGYKTILKWPGDPMGMYPRCRLDLIDSTPVIKTLDQWIGAWTYLCQNHQRYQIAVVDTSTELAKVFMADHLEKKKRVLAEQQDWGFVLSRLEWFFREMRNLPMTKIVLAHENMKYNNATGFNTYGPQFQGAIRFDYAKHFDEIWRMMLTQQQTRAADNSIVTHTMRFIQTSPDMNTEGKTRSNSLAQYELPQLDAMLYKMQS